MLADVDVLPGENSPQFAFEIRVSFGYGGDKNLFDGCIQGLEQFPGYLPTTRLALDSIHVHVLYQVHRLSLCEACKFEHNSTSREAMD